jgi:hypothetical protein
MEDRISGRAKPRPKIWYTRQLFPPGAGGCRGILGYRSRLLGLSTIWKPSPLESPPPAARLGEGRSRVIY